MTGRITLAATPIGNIADGSARLWQALASADVIAAEDTRRIRDLLARAEVTYSARIFAVHDHNEREAAGELVAQAAAGAQVVVVSDAGMPMVSDPGYRVMRAAIDAGVHVEVIPGPSAVLAALALSGLPTDRFSFEGFLPRKSGDRAASLHALAAEQRTMVFFEAPHRLHETLLAMQEVWGAERPASVSREITKTYEETIRGTLGSLIEWATGEVRGEITVVVSGRAAEQATMDDVIAEALERIAAGERAKEVSAELARLAGLPQREVYAAVVTARNARS